MVPQALRMADAAFKHYRTRDPFEIIDAKKIKLWDFEKPESLLAFYKVMNRTQYIGINLVADEVERRSGAIHELGHSLNDYKAAASGREFRDTFSDYKFFSFSNAPSELNANLTGADLCIADDYICDRIHYEQYLRLVAYIKAHIDHYRSERARMQFEEEQMQEFYDINSDMPSYAQLACELVVDIQMVKFKFKAMSYKNYDLPNIPETESDFLKNWQRRRDW